MDVLFITLPKPGLSQLQRPRIRLISLGNFGLIPRRDEIDDLGLALYLADNCGYLVRRFQP